MLSRKLVSWNWIVISYLFIFLILGVGCSSTRNNFESALEEEENSAGERDVEVFTDSNELSQKREELQDLIPESVYDEITAESRNNTACREHNRAALGLSDEPNGEWYYTYDNMIAGMAALEVFANEGGENTRKMEIAAFLANVAQETGGKVDGDPYGSPGCFIQEGAGAADDWVNPNYGGLSPTGKGYIGRGPHQLSWNSNYAAFGEDMGVSDEYYNDPDILTINPEIGIAGSIWFWGHEERTEWSPANIPFKPAAHEVLVGNWTPTTATTEGVRTSNDVECGRTEVNFGVIINLINGGYECGPNALAEHRVKAENRLSYFEEICDAMGVTIPDGFSDDCGTQKNFAECPSY